MSITTPFFMLADIEGFFGIVFMLIAIVGWVINLVNQNQDKGKQTRRRPPSQSNSRRKQNVQNEIDQFLGQAKRKSGRAASVETDDVEVIAPPPTRRAPPRRRRSRDEIIAEQSGRSIPNPQPTKQQKKKSSGGLAARHLESQNRQKSQSKKKAEKLSHISEHVEKDLPHAVDAHVSSHLHSFTAESPTATGQIGMSSTTKNRKTRGNLIGQLLSSKKDIRNAIIMNEILSPPRSLR